MKHIGFVVALVLLLTVLLPFGAVIADDITSAVFYAVITTSNTGTAATTVSSVVTGATTPAWVSGGFCNATATDLTVRNTSGAPIRFMPGWGTNSMCIYNGSLGANTITDYLLYTKGVTGGLISYFPGATGGTFPDTATEPGNNAKYTFTDALLNTDNGTSKDIISKYDSTNGGQLFCVNPYTSQQLDYNIFTGGGYYETFAAASSQYADKAAAVVAPSGAAISVFARAYSIAATGNNQAIISAGSAGASTFWSLYKNNAGNLIFQVCNSGGTGNAAQWTSTATLSYTTTYWIVAVYNNAATPKTTVYVNGASIAGTDAGAGGNIYQPNSRLVMGAMWTGAAYQNFWNGQLDEVGFYQGALTLADAQNFYYGGFGSAGFEFASSASMISLYHMENDANPNDTMANNNLTGAGGAANPVPAAGGCYTLTARNTYSSVTSAEHDINAGLTSPFLWTAVDATTPNPPVTTGLVLNAPLWQTECSASPFTGIDSMGRTITVTNATWSLNTGYTFDGAGDILNIPTNTDVNGSFTISGWIRSHNQAQNHAVIFSKGDNTGTWTNRAPWVVFNAGGIYGALSNTVPAMFTVYGSTAFANNTWYHFAFTYDNATKLLTIYVNGVSEDTDTLTGTRATNAEQYCIGDSADNDCFDGDMGDFKNYNTALTATQVLQNYNATKLKYLGTGNTSVYSTLATVPNSSAVTTLLEGTTAYYINSFEYWQAGAKVDLWDWEYAATFTGDTTHNVFTPSFRATSSDADVTSSLGSLQAMTVPTAPAFAVGGGPDFISNNITATETPNPVSGNNVLTYPGKSLIDAVATAGGVPYQIPSTYIGTFVLLVMSWLTSFFLKEQSANSIFAKSIVNTVGYGVLVALNIFDWWMLIFFFIFEQAIWFGGKERRE